LSKGRWQGGYSHGKAVENSAGTIRGYRVEDRSNCVGLIDAAASRACGPNFEERSR
jgi:hypothetical protein